MRISDWSSDVCSSDLGLAQRRRTRPRRELGQGGPPADGGDQQFRPLAPSDASARSQPERDIDRDEPRRRQLQPHARDDGDVFRGDRKSVVYGKSESISEDLVCSSRLNKKKNISKTLTRILYIIVFIILITTTI